MATVERDEWQLKATESQKNAIAEIKQEIILAREEKALADEKLLVVNRQIRLQVEGKKKERDTKIATQDNTLQDSLTILTGEIAEEETAVYKRQAEIKALANQTMKDERR